MGYKWFLGAFAAGCLLSTTAFVQAQTVVVPLNSLQGLGDEQSWGEQGLRGEGGLGQRQPLFEWAQDRDDRGLRAVPRDRRDNDEWQGTDRGFREQQRGMEGFGRGDFDRGYDNVSPYGGWGDDEEYREGLGNQGFNARRYGDQWLGRGTDDEGRFGMTPEDQFGQVQPGFRGREFGERQFGMPPEDQFGQVQPGFGQGEFGEEGREGFGERQFGQVQPGFGEREFGEEGRGEGFGERQFGMSPEDEFGQVQPGFGEREFGEQGRQEGFRGRESGEEGFNSRFETPERQQQFGGEQFERSGGQTQERQSLRSGTQGRTGSSGATGRAGAGGGAAAGGKASGGAAAGGKASGGGSAGGHGGR